MLVHLVRHAHALSRREWTGPDGSRPLSETGHLQARQFGSIPMATSVEVRSSPAVRCIETIRPLAETLGTEIVVDERLAEAADPQVVAEWMCFTHRFEEVVLCGHGDLLPEVLRLLQLRGMILDGPNAVAKASLWPCHIVDGAPVRATYTPPPPV
ncbi:MAG: histidine phosphatase family protein [Actinobacteria bacterium]|nr:histidine phosphatase family protein [Actinomycetota bacterium]